MTDRDDARTPRKWPITAAFDIFVAITNAVGSIWIFVIMVLICADVTLRYAFNSPIPGVPLVITMSLIAIVFLQLPDALFAGRVTRNAAVILRILERRPKLGRALNALYYLIGAAFVAVLVYYGIPVFEKAWRTNSYLGNRGDFTLPDWPFKLLIVVGSAMITIQYLRLAYANLCACFGKSLAGLDVPELESLD
jgi:TRAP-type mannitol/chloroaromatic compound transport system permease small subunit